MLLFVQGVRHRLGAEGFRIHQFNEVHHWTAGPTEKQVRALHVCDASDACRLCDAARL